MVFLTVVHHMSKVLRDLPVPVIARVNGWCLGAGLEVMAACDMSVLPMAFWVVLLARPRLVFSWR